MGGGCLGVMVKLLPGLVGGLLAAAVALSVGVLPAAAVDADPPASSHTLVPSAPDGDSGWYVSSVEMEITSQDLESGVARINHQVNGGGWNYRDFADSLNLVKNPSFEEGAGGSPDFWQWVPGASAVGQRTSPGWLGDWRVEINNEINDRSYWTNESDYVIVSPWETLSYSVNLETAAVAGIGARVAVFALVPEGKVLLTESVSYSGTTAWAAVGGTFTVAHNEAWGVFLELSLEGVGTAGFDGVVVQRDDETKVSLGLYNSGENLVEYYAVDHVGNEESPAKSAAVLIDEISPRNWHDFGLEREGNDHTYRTWISAGDYESGIDSASAFFQYSVDGGETWGHYENYGDCQGDWQADGWLPAAVAIDEEVATLTTPAVDYCNSNWSLCKVVRFRIKDIAGNESERRICLKNSWIKTSGGNVGSALGISFAEGAPEDNSDGLVLAGGFISGFSSARGWLLEEYPLGNLDLGYDWLVERFPPEATVGAIGLADGRFLVNGDLVVRSSTLPGDLDDHNITAVYFINGDLFFNDNLLTSDESALVFVVAGEIGVRKTVTRIDAHLFADDGVDSAYNGGDNVDPLVINGGVVSPGEIRFSRRAKSGQEEVAAEQINFPTHQLIFLADLLGEVRVRVREVSPLNL